MGISPADDIPTWALPYLQYRLLNGSEEESRAFEALDAAAEVGRTGTCERSLCGSVVVSRDGTVLGAGSAGQPYGACEPCWKKTLAPGFKSDRTCCTHAETRAILQALRNGHDLTQPGTAIFFQRLGEKGEQKHSGQPYCTICSKLAYEVGIEFFVLHHAFGIIAYPTKLYNELSYEYAG